MPSKGLGTGAAQAATSGCLCLKAADMCGVGSLIYDSGSVVEIKASGCRSWTCDTCAPIRKDRLEIQLRLGRPNYFLTLTCNPAIGKNPQDRRERMGKAFPRLMRRIHHRTGVKPEYGVIVEETLQGEPHFHVALRCAKIYKKWIKRWWHELTGAYMVDLQEVTDVEIGRAHV